MDRYILQIQQKQKKIDINPKNNKYKHYKKDKQILHIAKYQFSSPFIMSSLAPGILNYPNTIMFQNIVPKNVVSIRKRKY